MSLAADPFRILIVDDVHPLLLEKLGTLPGVQIDYRPDLEVSAFETALRTTNGLVIRTKLKVKAEHMAAAPGLRWIARAGAGLDNIDEAAAAALGIDLMNAPEGNRDAVGEHVVGMLLSLFNKLLSAHNEVVNGLWRREANRGIELGGKTVGLIGYGNNGRATAQKMSGFGVKILAYDKYRSGFGDEKVVESSMERIFEQADILSLHLPLTAESMGLVNADYLNRFEKPIWLVNAARGEIVKLAAVADALENGKLLGACLDVLENEKPASRTPAEQQLYDRLSGSGRVLFSPHVAGWTVESYLKISEVLAAKIDHWFNQQRSSN